MGVGVKGESLGGGWLRVTGWGLRVGVADRVKLWWKSWRLGLEWDLGVNLKIRLGVHLGIQGLI